MGIEFTAINEHITRRIEIEGHTVEVPTRVRLPERWAYYSLCHDNARALLRLLGADAENGQMRLSDARRAVVGARASFAKRAPMLVRADAWWHRAASVERRGAIPRIVPVASVRVPGLDEDGLMSRLDAFAAFLQAAADSGATSIQWD